MVLASRFGVMRLVAVMVGVATLGMAVARASPPDVVLEATNDQRRRGLSWSDGRPTIEASLFVPVADALTLGASASGLRGGTRHGGADAVIDPIVEYRRTLGLMQVSGGVTGHIFPGRGSYDYVEVEAAASRTVGPVQLKLLTAYAPRQNAIGGDNLYLGGQFLSALPGTAFTILGGVGHSSGRGDHRDRAARLRPDGAYWDYRLGIEHARGPLTTGLRFSATSIGTRRGPALADRHAGSRLTGYLRLAL